jgi:hypothetical protein
MQKHGKVSAERVLRHKIYGTPRKALDIKDVARKGTPREAATAFLKGIAPQLKIPADLGNLKYDKTVQSPLGTHVLFQQYHNKKPITGAWVKVDLDPQNRAYHFTNNTMPVKMLEKSAQQATKRAWSEADAKKKALAAVKATPSFSVWVYVLVVAFLNVGALAAVVHRWAAIREPFLAAPRPQRARRQARSSVSLRGMLGR